jgi:hypothetical protein
MRIDDDPIEAVVARADGAFVGTVVDVAGPNVVRAYFDVHAEASYRFEVEAVAVGPIGREIVVRGGTNSSSCGLALPVGSRVGLLVHREGGQWSAGSCSSMPPAELTAIGRPPDPSIPVPRDPPVDEAMAIGLIVVALAGAVLWRSRARTRHDPAPS